MKGYEICIRAMAAAGTRTAFTLLSEDVMEMVARMDAAEEGPTIVDARHEQNAVTMAEAYSRATGDIGVAIVGRGPALAQTGTALTTAGKGESDLLVLAAESALDDQTEAKHFDQEGYLRSTLGDVVTIRSGDRIATAFTEVLRRLDGGDGPTTVLIPEDVLNGDVDAVPDDWQPSASSVTTAAQPDARLEPAQDSIDAAIDAYLDSDATTPPMVIAGAGARDAGAREALEALAERTGAFLATTLRARSLFADHPYHVGIVGTLGTMTANQLLLDSNFVVAAGSSMDAKTIDGGELIGDDATVVHVDTDPVTLGNHEVVDVSIQGDARTVARRLDEALADMSLDVGEKFWTDRMERRIADGSAVETGSGGSDGLLHPGSLVAALDERLPDERVVVSDGGHFTMWVLDGISVPSPGDFVWLYEMMSIGLGFPAGVGVARSVAEREDRSHCLTFTGDGGFMMSLQELDTAVRHDLPLVCIVMNDEALGSEYVKLQKENHHPESAVIETPPIAEVASAMGATARTVRSLDDLEGLSALLEDSQPGPVVLDCRTDRDVRHRFYG